MLCSVEAFRCTKEKDTQSEEFVKDVKWTYLIPESIIITLIPRQNVEILNYLCCMSLWQTPHINIFCMSYISYTIHHWIEWKWNTSGLKLTHYNSNRTWHQVNTARKIKSKNKKKIIFIKRNHFFLCVVQSFILLFNGNMQVFQPFLIYVSIRIYLHGAL